MLAAHVYRPLITGTGLAMSERKQREENSKEMDNNITATDECSGF
jgi:hypothetical protein